MKLLFSLSIIYSAAGPWVGWNILLIGIATGGLFWWLKGYLFMLLSCKKSKKLQVTSA